MAVNEVKPLIYRPPPRWYFWTAFGTALAIHLTAVAVSQRHEAPPVDLPPQPPQVVEAVLAPPESTPPPEDIPIPEPPPPPDIKPEFVEERTPPPRQQQSAQKFTPITAPGRGSMARANARALYAPHRPFRYEARSRHVTGSGVIVCTVDSGSGSVTGCSVSSSTGSAILDSASTSAFRQWRFRPGTVSKVNIPITFTMTGASY